MRSPILRRVVSADASGRGERWECGSFFHWAPSMLGVSDESNLLPGAGVQVTASSGRAALQHVITYGRRELGWEILLVPSYFCQDVTETVKTQIDIVEYRSDPISQQIPTGCEQGQAILIPSYFGQRPPVSGGNEESTILDVTHDPTAEWVEDYPARFVIASLRKTLPLPEGGVAIDRNGQLGVLAEPSAERRRWVDTVLLAMTSKGTWLSGAHHDKQVWYGVLQQNEETFIHQPAVDMTPNTREIMTRLAVDELRRARMSGRQHLLAALPQMPASATSLEATLGLVLLFQDADVAQSLKNFLVGHGVFPACLWPQQRDAGGVELSERLLLLHTDFRYDEADLRRVALLLRAFFSGK